MTEKHTSGPWVVNHQNGTRIESEKEHGWVNDGWIIAKLEGPDAEANARLISAAPELLNALIECAKELEYHIHDYYDTIDPNREYPHIQRDEQLEIATVNRAKAVIAKATGKTE